MFRVEEHKGAKQHVRRVRSKLFALPQMLLLHPRDYVLCKRNKHLLRQWTVCTMLLEAYANQRTSLLVSDNAHDYHLQHTCEQNGYRTGGEAYQSTVNVKVSEPWDTVGIHSIAYLWLHNVFNWMLMVLVWESRISVRMQQNKCWTK
jgi:hypothetical protein